MSESQPLVSILIPCYNHESFVKDCIQSVIEQDYENIELLIIDDGSTDNSVEVIKKMIPVCQSRFKRFEFINRPNKGLCATLNEALKWCSGKYFAAIASDDILVKNKTTIQVQFLENNRNIIASFGSIQAIDSNSIKLKPSIAPNRLYTFKDVILKNGAIYSPTQMIRTHVIKEVGGYPENILIEDWYMWLKLSQLGYLHSSDKIFAFYRRHSSNTSSRIPEIQEARFQILELFKDSEFYEEGLKRLKWFNQLELFVSDKDNKIKNFIKMSLIDPKRTSHRIIKKYIKK